MIQLVDGKQKMLSRPEVVMQSIADTPDPERLLKQITVQHMSPNTFLVQRYNTVFMYKTDKSKGKAYGAMYNMDIPKNAVENILHFFTVLQRRKVNTYVTTFASPDLLALYREVQKRIVSKGYDSTVQLGTQEKGTKTRYVMAIELGKDRLRKGD